MKGLHHHTTLLVTPLLSGLHSFLFTYSRLDAHFRPLLMSIPSHVHHIYKINHKAPIRSQTYSQTARLNHYFYPPHLLSLAVLIPPPPLLASPPHTPQPAMH
jgi:hypothetical protein